MTDWNEFLNSDGFRAYRKCQIEQVGVMIESHLRQLVGGNAYPEQLSGAMAMARAIINIPETLTNDNELKDQLSIQKKEDYAALTGYLVRRKML